MPTRFNPIVTDYIANVEPFAKPIVKKLRAIFLKADRRLIENVKWGVPSYESDALRLVNRQTRRAGTPALQIDDFHIIARSSMFNRNPSA